MTVYEIPNIENYCEITTIGNPVVGYLIRTNNDDWCIHTVKRTNDVITDIFTKSIGAPISYDFSTIQIIKKDISSND